MSDLRGEIVASWSALSFRLRPTFRFPSFSRPLADPVASKVWVMWRVPAFIIIICYYYYYYMVGKPKARGHRAYMQGVCSHICGFILCKCCPYSESYHTACTQVFCMSQPYQSGRRLLYSVIGYPG